MRQDITSALSGLASFAKLQELLAARSHAGSVEAMMPFETFEVELGNAVRGLENELKAADLARYDVEADAVLVDGKAWRSNRRPLEVPRARSRGLAPYTVRPTVANASARWSCVLGLLGGCTHRFWRDRLRT